MEYIFQKGVGATQTTRQMPLMVLSFRQSYARKM